MTSPPGTYRPLVTFAILAYNRREALRINLTKLRDELDWPAEKLEVIVVDNASSDGTSDMVRAEFPAVQLIRSEQNTGISGWNRAFEAGTGEWFLVLDDDCYVTGDALRRAVAAAQEHGADLVSFKVTSPGGDAEVFNEFYETGLLAFWGCSALLSGRAARDLGGLDPGIFIWGHEAEFVARLLDRGWRHLHLPEVVSVHMKSPPDFKLAQHKRNLQSFGYIAGLRDGLGNRAPVRAAVSQLYRRNFIEFSSPLAFARGPVRARTALHCCLPGRCC
jgi:GT2 family glycosyltransferase